MRQVSRAALVLLLLAGCTPGANPPKPEPPCDARNPGLCPDGLCCPSYQPRCLGPDEEGYYCEANDYDPSDPTTWSARKRVRPHR